jgi:ribosomal protein L40E
MFLLSMIFIGLFLLMSSIQILIGGFILLVTSMAAFAMEKRPISVREARSQSPFVTYTPKAFLKKCIKCGGEIPIASEKCKYCGAKQPEYKADKW